MWAVFTAFVLNGFAFATWISRIPSVRAQLHLSPGQLGLVLLSGSVGAVLALPLAGLLVGRIGPRSSVTAMAGLMCAGVTTAGIGSEFSVVAVGCGLFLMGLGQGAWDVSMNVEGAAVEQRLARAIMPRFHAGFSVGTVLAAVLGAGAAGLGVPVAVHLPVLAVLIAVGVPVATRFFLPRVPVPSGQRAAGAAVLAAWREPRTLLIGVVVLAFAFAEGTGNDWLAVTTVDAFHAPAAIGSLVFAVFVAAMTAGRLVGPPLLDRFGRVPVLRATAALATLGLVAVVFGTSLVWALIGAVAWGLGASLGFPVGMSAAADDPERAAARVSVASSIGYTAFLAGPPLIGLLGNHIGVQRGLSVAAALLVIGFLAAGSTRLLPGATLGARTARDQRVRSAGPNACGSTADIGRTPSGVSITRSSPPNS